MVTENQTTILGLDIEGAFDNVNQRIIIDKQHKELANHSVRWWIAEFITNRTISVKVGQYWSSERKVLKGVPQGSALGPVLWNYTIGNLHRAISMDPRTHSMLIYADDITVVAHGSKHQETQRIIDNIIDYLEGLSLRVNPTKTEQLTIRGPSNPRPRSDMTAKLTIRGEVIRQCQHITLLGITINEELRVELKENEYLASRVKNNQKLLRHISNHQIVTDNQEWRTLIKSMITSVTTYNILPMLAVDSKARAWCNSVHDKTLLNTFKWPHNTPLKVIRTIADLQSAEEILCAQLAKGVTNDGHRL